MAEKEKEKEEAAPEGENAEGADAAKKKKKKLIIIIAAVVMLLVAGGAGAYFMGMFGGKKEEAAEAGKEGEHGKKGEHGEAVNTGPAFFEVPQILVNLNTGGKQASFIKLTVTLEIANGAESESVKANMPRLMDSYNTFLREMRASDLQGSAGVYRLREEMLTRANKVLAPVKVKDVLFKEIVIQ